MNISTWRIGLSSSQWFKRTELFKLDGSKAMQGNSSQKIFNGGIDLTGFSDAVLKAQTGGNSDQVTISKEGMEHIRNQLDTMGISRIEDGLRKDSEEDIYIFEHLDINRMSIYGELAKDFSLEDGWAAFTVSDHKSIADDLADVYISLRQQIITEYAKGTREVWTLTDDPNEEGAVAISVFGETMHCRKLTMEEELTRASVAFDKYTDDVVTHYKYNKIQQDLIAYCEMTYLKQSAKGVVEIARRRGWDIPGLEKLDADFFFKIDNHLKRLKEIMDKDTAERVSDLAQQIGLMKGIVLQNPDLQTLQDIAEGLMQKTDTNVA